MSRATTLETGTGNMNATQLKALSKVILNGWKDLANDSQDDADTVVELMKGLLEKLETFVDEVEVE